VTAQLLERFAIAPGSLILEVGGGPGPLEEFLPQYELFVSDISGAHLGRYFLADGSALPFANETFAAVVTLDVLEHVPAEIRPAFLSELLRVSADLVVLSAPFASAELELAEEALNEFIRARFQGDFPTLDEHADNGLPELGPTTAALADDGFSAATLPSGYLPRWLMGMLVHHELLATGLPHLGKLHAYYNAVVSPLDSREPAYRHVIVSARSRPAAEVQRIVDSLLAPGDVVTGQTALNAIAGTVMTHRLNAVARSELLGRELDHTRELVAVRERELADRVAHIIQLERRVHELQEENEVLHAYLQRRWLGIPAAARRMKAKLTSPKETPAP
jgi:SAM-dependent methyltransferase